VLFFGLFVMVSLFLVPWCWLLGLVILFLGSRSLSELGCSWMSADVALGIGWSAARGVGGVGGGGGPGGGGGGGGVGGVVSCAIIIGGQTDDSRA
jgi:hypothetical protein